MGRSSAGAAVATAGTAARAARITPAVAKGRPSKNPPALPPRFLPSVVWERLRAIIKQVAAALNRSKVLLPGSAPGRPRHRPGAYYRTMEGRPVFPLKTKGSAGRRLLVSTVPVYLLAVQTIQGATSEIGRAASRERVCT